MNRILIAAGNFFFRFRNALFPVIFIMLTLFTRPALFLGNPYLDKVVVWLGVTMALLGQGFRLFVIGYAYIKRGGKDRRVYADNLVIKGFYAHTRNPMYAGNFLIAVGLGLVYGSPWVYFFVIPFFAFVYLSIVTAEETYLSKRFGQEYEDYRARVNRFIPNLQGIGKSLRELHYDWKRAIRKDYGTLFGTLLGSLMINLWKNYYLYGLAEKKDVILTMGIMIILGFLVYLFVRFLKLTGRLNSPDLPTA